MQFRLLDCFRGLFAGVVYNHRVSTNGDRVAYELYEDLLDLDRSLLLSRRIAAKTHVLNTTNRTFGKESRRGDGTFGELVPTEHPREIAGYRVARGPTATLEIAAEAKIICVAQSRQIDRVCSDLQKQAQQFKSVSENCLSVAIIGVNRADRYRSIEGASKPRDKWRETFTNGSGSLLHPAQESQKTISALTSRVSTLYDEFLVFEFVATNEDSLNFAFHDEVMVRRLYASALLRIARRYGKQFSDD